jgi:asparagine synthase (glutamine-hydrolysing)
MQKLSNRAVKTFTIGFGEAGYDEAKHAKGVAQHLGTDHTELYITPEQAREVIPRLPEIYDEPFADSSQIPTHLVAALARQQITVALSGDGGDEMFCGYNRYLLTSKLWDRINRTPVFVRSATARALTTISSSAWTKFGNAAGSILPAWAKFDRLGDKMHKGAPLLTSSSVEDLYSGMVSLWSDPQVLVLGAGNEQAENRSVGLPTSELGPIEQMMALDAVSYLPDDILVKVDRAAMAVSLETRVPYVDHRVVEFAWRIPQNLKIKDGTTKWILRELLYRYVPRDLIERPKMGFAVPIGDWLRGPLRPWAEALLDESRLRSEGYLRPEPIRKTWELHLSGHSDHHARLWVVLMFQSWLEAHR